MVGSAGVGTQEAIASADYDLLRHQLDPRGRFVSKERTDAGDGVYFRSIVEY